MEKEITREPEATQQTETGETPGKRRLTPEQRERRRLRRRKRRIRLIILWTVFLLATAVLVFTIVALIFTALERKAARDQYAEMQQLYEATDTPAPVDAAIEATPQPTIDPNKWYAGKAAFADKRIDFTALQQRNADVCGWITVDGTSIDYPILRAEGKDVLYLSHDIDGQPSEHGTVCLDVLSARDFSDRVTLIYGHNMKDGSMFAPLYQYYRDADFFNADHRVHIYIDDVMLEYRVFSACEFNYAHPLFFYDMTDDGEFLAYMDSFLENRDLQARILPLEITPEDHILTLITSTNVRADQRLFLQAVLVDGE